MTHQYRSEDPYYECTDQKKCFVVISNKVRQHFHFKQHNLTSLKFSFMCTCSCARWYTGQKLASWCLPHPFSALVFDTGSSAEPRALRFGETGWPMKPRDPLVSASLVLELQAYYSAWIFTRVPGKGSKSLVPVLAW